MRLAHCGRASALLVPSCAAWCAGPCAVLRRALRCGRASALLVPSCAAWCAGPCAVLRRALRCVGLFVAPAGGPVAGRGGGGRGRQRPLWRGLQPGQLRDGVEHGRLLHRWVGVECLLLVSHLLHQGCATRVSLGSRDDCSTGGGRLHVEPAFAGLFDLFGPKPRPSDGGGAWRANP